VDPRLIYRCTGGGIPSKKVWKSREQSIAARPARKVAFPIRVPETIEQRLALDGAREP
jgi:hypothetical protein